MNQAGCPALFATDEVFQRGSPGSCDTSLIGFYIYLSAIATMALITAIKQAINWVNRPNHTSRVPRGPISSIVFACSQYIAMMLYGMNVVNFSNGASFSVFSIMFLNFAYAYSVGVIRIVRLGEKIIPKYKRQETEEATRLRTFDGLGKAMLFLQISFLLFSSLALIILSPILTDHEDVISRIGWGCKSIFMALCQCGYWYQFERCIRAIKKIAESNAATTSMQPGEQERRMRESDLKAAIVKMRMNQLVHVSASPATIIFFLLAVGAINGNIWVVYVSALVQTIGGLFFEFSVKPPRKKNVDKTVEVMKMTSAFPNVPSSNGIETTS